ncbi:transport and Golgi organization protein 2 isoform X2 [Episyrphus balteatus]|uniref:transport and Golgi organization protein 2 isoform X2 n=1 Tax=Episyrphus balteatus TaxID=286459 RepID=UPI002485149C|nr:transport and Golgi organization protein 2 isoform X2 [Episyrphus balteatus]
MCVIFFYVNSNPEPNGIKLIVVSNRDEFYSRETLHADRWQKFPHVFGGIDLQAGREGGTWLAVSGKNGSFKLGALLNVTGEPKLKDPESRGMIVSDFVSGDLSTQEYNRQILADAEKYNAFNFVSIEINKTSSSIMLSSNAPKDLKTYKESECYGFGNSPGDSPFQKVIAGRKQFEEILQEYLKSNKENKTSQNDLVSKCFDLLKNETKHWPDAELAGRAPNWGNYLSAINVKIPDAGYGSRTHSVIIIDSADKMHFYEETMESDDPNGKWHSKCFVEQFFKNENGNSKI